MPKDKLSDLRALVPPVEHPVVRVHPETERRSIFVNAVFTVRILGLAEIKSQQLLHSLYRHLSRPEFHCRLRWRAGTVAFWDNRATQHYAVSDYYPARRIMERIAIRGDRPLGPHAAGGPAIGKQAL